jgi:hypothetical protein
MGIKEEGIKKRRDYGLILPFQAAVIDIAAETVGVNQFTLNFPDLPCRSFSEGRRVENMTK